MKKIFCLALIVLTLVCVFTGCTGPVQMAERGMADMYNDMNRNDRSNVSTSRNGTVNGRNRNGGLMDKSNITNGGMNGNNYTANPGTR